MTFHFPDACELPPLKRATQTTAYGTCPCCAQTTARTRERQPASPAHRTPETRKAMKTFKTSERKREICRLSRAAYVHRKIRETLNNLILKVCCLPAHTT